MRGVIQILLIPIYLPEKTMHFANSRIKTSIAEQLTGLAKFVLIDNAMGNTDFNKGAEDFFCQLLNIGFDLNLRNMNAVQKNYPAIDLGDERAKVCVQVTSENSASKLTNTIAKFKEYGLDKKFDNLIFLVISEKSLPKVQIVPNLEIDVWGVSALATNLVSEANTDKLERINSFIRNNLKSDVKAISSILPSMLSEPDFDGNCKAFLKHLRVGKDDPFAEVVRKDVKNLHKIMIDLTDDQKAFLYWLLRYGDAPVRGSGFYDGHTLTPTSTIDEKLGRDRAFRLFKSLTPYNLVRVESEYQPDQYGPYIEVFDVCYYGESEIDILSEIREFCIKNNQNNNLLRRVVGDADFSPLC